MLLSDLTVLDWSEGVSGPFAARLLADLGADVIKVERLGYGDTLREQDEFLGNNLFPYVNAGKKSIALNLETEEGIARLKDLLKQSSAVIESQDRANLERWGLTRADLHAINPNLAVTSVKSFFEDDPLAGSASSDLTLQHHSGFAYQQARPVDFPRTTPPASAADREAPLLAGIAIGVATLWALLRSERTSSGSSAEFALGSFYSLLLFEQLSEWCSGERNFNRVKKGKGAEVAGGLIWIIRCIDGWAMISPREQHQWDRWMQVLGHPSWEKDDKLCGTASARKTHWGELQELMTEWSVSLTRDDVFKRAQSAMVPCFPVSYPEDALSNEHLQARNFFDRVEIAGQTVRVPGLPYILRTSAGREIPRGRVLHAPSLGNSDAEISRNAGSQRNIERGEQQSSSSPSNDILRGFRVVDFSWVVAGPMATRMLAAMGAEVIKIESSQRPEFKARGGVYPIVNAGKRSFTVDITKPEGQGILHRLVAMSDAVVENFSSRVLKKYSLDYESLRKHRPDLIFCSGSGLGRSGPLSDALAYGTLLQGFSGRASLVGEINPNLDAMGIFPAWTDPVTAMWEVLTILAAERHRKRTGEGAYIDMSMLESTIALLPESIFAAGLKKAPGPRGGNREPEAAPVGCFLSADPDGWVVLSVRDNAEWQALCRVLGRDAWTNDPALQTAAGRIQARPALNEAVASWIGSLQSEEATRRLRNAGVPAAQSRSLGDLMQDEAFVRSGVFPSVGNGWSTFALPWRAQDGWNGEHRPAPELGDANGHVLRGLLGMSDAEIAQLVEEKVIN